MAQKIYFVERQEYSDLGYDYTKIGCSLTLEGATEMAKKDAKSLIESISLDDCPQDELGAYSCKVLDVRNPARNLCSYAIHEATIDELFDEKFRERL